MYASQKIRKNIQKFKKLKIMTIKIPACMSFIKSKIQDFVAIFQQLTELQTLYISQGCSCGEPSRAFRDNSQIPKATSLNFSIESSVIEDKTWIFISDVLRKRNGFSSLKLHFQASNFITKKHYRLSPKQ